MLIQNTFLVRIWSEKLSDFDARAKGLQKTCLLFFMERDISDGEIFVYQIIEKVSMPCFATDFINIILTVFIQTKSFILGLLSQNTGWF